MDRASFTATAPVIFRCIAPGSGKGDQQIECGGGTADEQEQYIAALRAHILTTKGLTQGVPGTMLFRLAAAQLPAGASAPAPWVEHAWAVPAAELADIVETAKKLMSR